MHNYDLALSFAEQHAAKEQAGSKETRGADSGGRSGSIWAAGEGDEKQKPAKWRDYCSRAFTLAWHIFKAHVDSSLEK